MRRLRWLPCLLLPACDLFFPDGDGDDTAAVETDVQETAVEDPCPQIPDEGKCDGNTLVTCENGRGKRTDCDLKECGLNEDGLYECLDVELDGNPPANDLDGMLGVFGGVVTTNRDGIVAFSVDGRGITSFLAHATPPAGYQVWLATLYDPSGDVIRLDNPILTASVFAGADSTLAWPSRDEDGPLEAGEYVVAFQVVDDQGFGARNVDVDVSLITKDDPDLSSGQLHVALIYPGVSEVDADVGAGVDLAIEGWRSIYARSGLELIVDPYVAAGLDAIMPEPNGADDGYYSSLASQTVDYDIVLVIGEDFRPSADPLLLGQSGNIPGTTGAGPRAAIAVSWARHAGVNGRFNADEVSSLATTLAHEVGHYAGLFHPVESTWANYDPLGDTPECTDEGNCYNRLGNNLMFPASTCFAAGCEDDVRVTDEQASVLHLYPGTL